MGVNVKPDLLERWIISVIDEVYPFFHDTFSSPEAQIRPEVPAGL